MKYEIQLDAEKPGPDNLKALEKGLVDLISEYYKLDNTKHKYDVNYTNDKIDDAKQVPKIALGVTVKPNKVMDEINKAEGKQKKDEKLPNRILEQIPKGTNKNIKSICLAIQNYRPDVGLELIGPEKCKSEKSDTVLYMINTQERFKEINNKFIKVSFGGKKPFIAHPSAQDIDKEKQKIDKNKKIDRLLLLYNKLTIIHTCTDESKTLLELRKNCNATLGLIGDSKNEETKEIFNILSDILSKLGGIETSKLGESLKLADKVSCIIELQKQKYPFRYYVRAKMELAMEEIKEELLKLGKKVDKYKSKFGQCSDFKEVKNILKSEHNNNKIFDFLYNKNIIEDNIYGENRTSKNNINMFNEFNNFEDKKIEDHKRENPNGKGFC